MPKIKLKVESLNKIQKEQDLNDSELSKKIGISRNRLWRAKLQETHREYCSPGELFIAGVLKAFPDKSFDDLFFLDNSKVDTNVSVESEVKI